MLRETKRAKEALRAMAVTKRKAQKRENLGREFFPVHRTGKDFRLHFSLVAAGLAKPSLDVARDHINRN